MKRVITNPSLLPSLHLHSLLPRRSVRVGRLAEFSPLHQLFFRVG